MLSSKENVWFFSIILIVRITFTIFLSLYCMTKWYDSFQLAANHHYFFNNKTNFIIITGFIKKTCVSLCLAARGNFPFINPALVLYLPVLVFSSLYPLTPRDIIYNHSLKQQPWYQSATSCCPTTGIFIRSVGLVVKKMASFFFSLFFFLFFFPTFRHFVPISPKRINKMNVFWDPFLYSITHISYLASSCSSSYFSLSSFLILVVFFVFIHRRTMDSSYGRESPCFSTSIIIITTNSPKKKKKKKKKKQKNCVANRVFISSGLWLVKNSF